LTRALALVVALVPSLAWAQAEPAPEDYVPPGRTKPLPPPPPPESPQGPEAPPKWHVAIAPHLTVRFGSAPMNIPTIGYGAGVSFVRALVPFAGAARFGIGADFTYDRFPGDATWVAHAGFVGMLVVDALVGPQKRIRPWAGAGAGISAAQYRVDVGTAAMRKDIFSAAGLVRVGLGLSGRVWRWLELGLHGELDFTFGQTELTTSWFSAALDLGSSF
jgi:hypothetical protein